jgi:hypothetical protein
VHDIAARTGTSEKLVRALDEHTRGAIENLIGGVLMGETFSQKEYLAELMRAAHAIGKHGRAVVIGRGVQFILDGDEALRVRVVCPPDVRVQNLVRAHKISVS